MSDQIDHTSYCSKPTICLFGLSADPPTGSGGHVGMLQALMDTLPPSTHIYILPVYRHTFSEKRQRMVDFDHRLNMCRRAFQPLIDKDPQRIVLSDAERQAFVWATTKNQ